MKSTDDRSPPSQGSHSPTPMGPVEAAPAGSVRAIGPGAGSTGPAPEWAWPSSRRRTPRTPSHRPVWVVRPHAMGRPDDRPSGR
jgi:hypothetical protein